LIILIKSLDLTLLDKNY